ncbi:MAG TPA: Xaa-Pro peptidase family protein [Candidatus Dormibacteraeota bacterium]|nr:Xaa-Pro peptidase family protein [Candidatus Dormibacteraeota bacterium]
MALDRLREWMGSASAGAACLTDPVSIAYLTGFATNPHERLMALVLRDGDAVLVVPGLEEESAAAAARGVSVRAWRDGDDPWALVAAALGDGSPGRLAVEKGHLSLERWERLRGLAGGAEPIDAGAELRRLRARKTPGEIERLEQAARLTDEVTERAMAEIRPGRTELEVAAAIDHLVATAGARLSFATIVQSGPNSAQPHLGPGDRTLRTGDLVLLDFGAASGGYKADTTRTVVIGEPDARQREVHALVLAAHDAAVATVRPGVTVGEVDEAARAVIRAGGLGDRFIHRVGHGLGLEAHEDPSLDPGGRAALEPGMAITIEPGVYLPGWGGVRIEDDVLVEAAGGRQLTRADRTLRSVG